METRSEQSIKRLVRTLKKYRSFQLNVSGETIHAAVPLPPDLAATIQAITGHELPH
uniref:hypothetical protein n=1 Tax=Corynebacterium riegelii TaxID=156976 RepID=UPI00288905AE|nr:hypothetical protein [Corynebacterium riegelii]